jgi:hypothetical protein
VKICWFGSGGKDLSPWGRRALLAGLCLWGSLLMIEGCSHLDRSTQRGTDTEHLAGIADRLTSFGGFRGAGTLRIEYLDQKIDLPFTARISEDAALEVQTEVNNIGVPFGGRIRVTSGEAGSVAYTDVGVFDLGEVTGAGSAIHVLLLSLFGGGDWLALWLRKSGCDLGRQVECDRLRVDLKIDDGNDSVVGWTLKVAAGEVSFSGFVSEFHARLERFPRVVTGTFYPYGVIICVEYDDVQRLVE